MPKQPKPLTKTDLTSALKGLATKKDLERYATKRDLHRLHGDLREEFALKVDLKQLGRQIDEHTRTVDHYLKKTQDWKQEQDILRGRLNRITEILVEKGVATEEELSLLGHSDN